VPFIVFLIYDSILTFDLLINQKTHFFLESQGPPVTKTNVERKISESVCDCLFVFSAILSQLALNVIKINTYSRKTLTILYILQFTNLF